MTTIIIDKNNTLPAFQKIIKLISIWKRLEVKEIENENYNNKIQKKLDKAIKEYEKWEYTTLLSIK